MKYLIDFDGVILDSQERFKRVMKDNKDLYDWMDYLSSIEWYNFLRECYEIDDSLESIKKLQSLKRLKGIITRIHSFEEGKEKLLFLRENGIFVPIFYSLPEQKKSTVYIPNNEVILIDDDVNNCKDWERNGGQALLFKPNFEGNSKRIIKSLKDVL